MSIYKFKHVFAIQGVLLFLLAVASHGEISHPTVLIEELHEKDGIYYNTNGEVLFSGAIQNYFKNNKIKHKGFIKFGKFHGEWIHFEENGNITLLR